LPIFATTFCLYFKSKYLFAINNNNHRPFKRFKEKEERLKWQNWSSTLLTACVFHRNTSWRYYSQSVHLESRKRKYCVIWTIDTSLWIAPHNADLIGSAMCKRMDINLGAGGRNIHKQASKNLYTAVVLAIFFLSTIGSGIFAILSWTRIFYGYESRYLFMNPEWQCSRNALPSRVIALRVTRTKVT